MGIPHIEQMPQAEIEHLLHTGKIITTFHLDDLFIHYEFTSEDRDFVMSIHGLVGEEAQRIYSRDFVRLLIKACFAGATYEHDLEKEERYKRLDISTRIRLL